MKIRRINLYAGSGAGKSLTSAMLFAELKKLNVNIEQVTEYVKIQAIQKRFPESFDQFHIMGRQVFKEDQLLPYVDLIVTDSPLLLNAAYSKEYKCPFWQQCVDVALMFEEKYPSLNIFLDRKDLIYDQIGRYQDIAKAIEMDKNILKLLDENKVNYEIVDSKDFDKILMMVKNRCIIN